MTGVEQHLNVIQRVLPEAIHSLKRIEEGWTNIVIEINDEWIFRFLRNPGNTQMVVERAFLPRFERQSSLPIPHIEYSGEDFIAYRKIKGERLSVDVFSRLSEERQGHIAKHLGEFLTTLHTFKFEHEYLVPAPFGGADFWMELWPLVSPFLSQTGKKRAEAYFRNTIDEIEGQSFSAVITHSDFGTNNVLIDPETQEITGVIDFGDMSFNDPAIDFSTFYRRFGRGFAETMFEYYSPPAAPPVESNFWTRVKYQGFRKLFFVVYFASHNRYEESIPGIVEEIEKLFEAPVTTT